MQWSRNSPGGTLMLVLYGMASSVSARKRDR